MMLFAGDLTAMTFLPLCALGGEIFFRIRANGRDSLRALRQNGGWSGCAR